MKILIGGDFATTSRGEKAVKEKKAFSNEIVNLIKDADISILNLEAPIADLSDNKIKVSSINSIYPLVSDSRTL